MQCALLQSIFTEKYRTPTSTNNLAVYWTVIWLSPVTCSSISSAWISSCETTDAFVCTDEFVNPGSSTTADAFVDIGSMKYAIDVDPEDEPVDEGSTSADEDVFVAKIVSFDPNDGDGVTDTTSGSPASEDDGECVATSGSVPESLTASKVVGGCGEEEKEELRTGGLKSMPARGALWMSLRWEALSRVLVSNSSKVNLVVDVFMMSPIWTALEIYVRSVISVPERRKCRRWHGHDQV